jgi:tetratricopeptide (TPR) repeat protein
MRELSFDQRIKPASLSAKNAMKKFILALLLLVPAFGAYADNSPKDVQALIAKGDYTGAEAMLRDAVSAHPQSAKAHYVLAEVLAHEGNVGEAKAEATKASQLDPETKFTDPARFRHFQQELDQALSPAPKAHTAATTTPYNNPQPAVSNGGGSSSMLVGILVFGAVIVLIIVLWSRRRRSANEYMNNPPRWAMPPHTPTIRAATTRAACPAMRRRHRLAQVPPWRLAWAAWPPACCWTKP